MREELLLEKNEDALVAEIVSKVAEKIISVQKKALVVYTGSLIGFVPALVSLQQLQQAGFTFDLFLSKSASELLDVETIRTALTPGAFYQEGSTDTAPELLASPYYTVIVPAMTVNTAAKIASCVADTPAARIISNSMMRGKNVIISVDGCCPYNPARAEKGYRMTEAVKAKLSQNIETLKDFGAKLCSSDTLAYKTMKLIEPNQAAAAKSVKSESKPKPNAAQSFTTAKRVIGRQEVIALPSRSVLKVPANALVTQFALDTARLRGVRIVKEV